MVSQSAYTDVRKQQPRFTLSSSLHEGVCGQSEDVGMTEELVHLYFSLSFLTSLTVMAKDPLQSVETAVV